MGREMKERDLTAYCGLYCGDCIRYQSRASELADELLKEIEKTKFTEYAKIKQAHKKELEDFGTFVSLLKAISEIKCEIRCRLGDGGCGGKCEIIECVNSKGLEGCWDCVEFERCDKFDFLKPYHADAPLKNVRKIKELGIENWAKSREKCYPWL
jgi:hypothetical protein